MLDILAKEAIIQRKVSGRALYSVTPDPPGRAVAVRAIIDADVANDPCAAANAPVPGGFAGFYVAARFIGNAGVNKTTHLVPSK